MKLSTVVVVAAVVALVSGDTHMYHQGNNNKFNERANNVEQDERLFDSQNGTNHGIAPCSLLRNYVGGVFTTPWSVQHGTIESRTEQLWKYYCSPDIVLGNLAGGQAARTKRSLTPGDAANNDRALHEPLSHYLECQGRSRNRGLFLADQNLNGNRNTAQFTRQDRDGTRYGYECPEIRDYWPNWSPTVWRDIEIMTNNFTVCEDGAKESQNVMDKYICVNSNTDPAPITESECTSAPSSGTWERRANFGLDEPICSPMPFARDCHHGGCGGGGHCNSELGGQDTDFYSQNITITQNMADEAAGGMCVIYMQYNISTTDYDPYAIGSESNGEENSPVVEDDPWSGGYGHDIDLLIDTSQYGRVFGDRTNPFVVTPRPDTIPDGVPIVQVGRRGDTGNNQQNSQGIEAEYDELKYVIEPGTWLHMMFCASDYEPAGNTNPGTATQIRFNVCQQLNNDRGELFPAPLEEQTIFADEADAANACFVQSTGATLDDGPDSYEVITPAPTTVGEYNFLNTRNNQITNRDFQSQFLVGDTGLSVWEVFAIVAGGAVLLAGLTAAGLFLYGRSHPHSRVGAMVQRKSLMSHSSGAHSHYASNSSRSRKRSAGGRSKGSSRSNRSR